MTAHLGVWRSTQLWATQSEGASLPMSDSSGYLSAVRCVAPADLVVADVDGDYHDRLPARASFVSELLRRTRRTVLRSGGGEPRCEGLRAS